MKQLSINKFLIGFLFVLGVALIPTYNADAYVSQSEDAYVSQIDDDGGGGNVTTTPTNSIVPTTVTAFNFNLTANLDKPSYAPGDSMTLTSIPVSMSVCLNLAKNFLVTGTIVDSGISPITISSNQGVYGASLYDDTSGSIFAVHTLFKAPSVAGDYIIRINTTYAYLTVKYLIQSINGIFYLYDVNNNRIINVTNLPVRIYRNSGQDYEISTDSSGKVLKITNIGGSINYGTDYFSYIGGEFFTDVVGETRTLSMDIPFTVVGCTNGATNYPDCKICDPDGAWYGNFCAPPSGRLYVTPTCKIKSGESTCPVYVTWQTFILLPSMPYRTYLKIIRNNPDNTFLSNSKNLTVTDANDSSANGGEIEEIINYGVSTFKIFFKDEILPQGGENYNSYYGQGSIKVLNFPNPNATATASCIEGTSWNGEKCVPSTTDLCPNDSGIQTTLPCPSDADKCPNDPGIQTTLPCPNTTDLCPNTPGIQLTLPCPEIPPVDLCPNTSGIQTTLPCPPVDLCPNIPGVQTTLPCPSSSPIGTLTGDNCEIKKNESTCKTTLTWGITNPVSGAATNITKPVNNQVASGLIPASKSNIVVNYPSTTFYLNHNSDTRASRTINASCVSGTGWDGEKCVDNGDGNGDGDGNGGGGTCTDGIKNGDETGVDIGGRCGIGTGTCTDGIKNGDETGVDIGGRCGTGGGTCTDGIKNQNETGVDIGGICGGGHVLNITFTATPSKIFKGRFSTLTWSSSPGTESCKDTNKSGFGRFDTGTKKDSDPSNPVTVYPTKTTRYEISCTRNNITEAEEVTVQVNSISVIET